MGLLDYFISSRSKGTANVAKERLQILVAHDRAARDQPSYLPQLQEEILAVIRKYVDVDLSAVSVNYEQEDSHEVLELNIVLPDTIHQRA
ncbi:cell division topological specificity factor MinE [Thiorhodococcus mannitoliphagus]|uniref:Cell division topological specificity factor n=1 Tax=Thiorhodococcus mannitoliphagus TaxID=329406 RepID=A0A6P1DQ39_9GAMM|nr:cell division topological specificity factor MinE [Thiorhodococcus mannitoliphagus]NEX19041.1 cell division topological specificity factor MinE [Thiorhodococcus mannitoliphagus]